MTLRSALLLAGLALAAAMPAEGPAFELVGSATPKITYVAPAWDAVATSTWGLAATLRPKFAEGPVTAVADTSWSLPLSASLAAVAPTVSVPEAYVRLAVGDALDLTFGQKRFPLGVGQTFTVGDSLNPTFGFFDQKTGFRGFTAEFSPVSWASVSAALSTESGRADDWTGAAQVSVLAGQLQATASVVARDNVTLNPAVGLSYDLFGLIVTAEAAAELLPQGLRPSGAWGTWKAPEPWTPVLSGSVGARLDLSLGDADLTLSAETLHWGQGWSSDEAAAWQAALDQAVAAHQAPVAAALGALRAGLPLRGQDNAFFRLALAYGDASLGAFAALDLQDLSAVGQVSATWTLADNLDLTAALQTSQGDAGDAWQWFDAAHDQYLASFATTYHF